MNSLGTASVRIYISLWINLNKEFLALFTLFPLLQCPNQIYRKLNYLDFVFAVSAEGFASDLRRVIGRVISVHI
jgi:hypothetical protein